MTDIILGLQGDMPIGSRKHVPFIGSRDKVAAGSKHYLGDGGTIQGINEGNTVMSSSELSRVNMPAYNDSSWNGVKMHANHQLVTGYLKNTLKFKGFVISDWQGIDRITRKAHSNYTYSILTGVNTGIDMIMLATTTPNSLMD